MGDSPSLGRRSLRWLQHALALAGAALLVFHLGFGLLEVVGRGMQPTLRGGPAGDADNDWVLYERLSTRLGAPARQALLVHDSEDGLQVARRVVALGGEQVRIAAGRVEVDGTPLALPAGVRRYVAAGRLRPDPGQAPYRVPAGEVLVLGDDGGAAWDGRFCGGLAPERWQGRALCVVWPPARWRWLW